MQRREFGSRIHGATYRLRPGSYVVLCDARQRVAVVRTAAGCFLPGGGSVPGEGETDTVTREVREETGFEVTRMRPLGWADEFVLAAIEGFVIKRGAFFAAEHAGDAAGEGEEDHEVLWLSPGDAVRRLRHESHAWAVRRALEPGDE